MTRHVCVYGLWHLGSVTAACLASIGQNVVAWDPDPKVVLDLKAGRAPIAEPGLDDLLQRGLRSGLLSFTDDPKVALQDADVLWVTFDTPLDEDDDPDVGFVRDALERARPFLRPDALVLVSSQVPVGFTRAIEQEWRTTAPGLRFACSPENLQLGKALDAFLHPARIVVGLGQDAERSRLEHILAPLGSQIEWMRLESAEMTKHALNGFLAVSAAYANELGRLCEKVGADAQEVERGLKTEPRIGPRAYVRASGPIAGGTLLRDVGFLEHIAHETGVEAPVVSAVGVSNRVHQAWVAQQVERLMGQQADPTVALLGLTYKPDTDTLRGSAAIGFAQDLLARNVRVQAFDPAIREVSAGLARLQLADSAESALDGADVAVLFTPWPVFKALAPDVFVARMRRPQVVDQAGFLAPLGQDKRLRYVRVGAPDREAAGA